MRVTQSLLLLAISLSSVHAVPSSRKECAHKVKETIHPPQGWVKQVPAPADHIINLRIALPQPNFDVLESHLYEVSDPDHSRYGDHLTKEEVEALVAPHDESIEKVNEWLASHGFDESAISRSPAKDWVKLAVPVAIAEKMLKTVSSSKQIIRISAYHRRSEIPHLAPH